MSTYATKETRKIKLCLLFFTNSLKIINLIFQKKKLAIVLILKNCFAQLLNLPSTYLLTLCAVLRKKVVGNSPYSNEVFSV